MITGAGHPEPRGVPEPVVGPQSPSGVSSANGRVETSNSVRIKCESKYRWRGNERIFTCSLEAPHDREPKYGFAAVGCHRDDESGHFWSDADAWHGDCAKNGGQCVTEPVQGAEKPTQNFVEGATEPDRNLEMDHSEMEELVCAAGLAYCDYNDGGGDDGFPAFALIRIDSAWTAVCAFHAHAAAAGEMERNWTAVERRSS